MKNIIELEYTNGHKDSIECTNFVCTNHKYTFILSDGTVKTVSADELNKISSCWV